MAFLSLTVLFSTNTMGDDLCFDYNTITESQSFAKGFAAASCVGYYAATVESKAQVFQQLKGFAAPAADTIERMSCGQRNIVIGREGDSESKFNAGYKTAQANAAMVQAGSMSMTELKMRAQTCSGVTSHYLKQLQTINE